MLVIKAEIWPHGEVEKQFEIARIGIINRGMHRGVADYNVIGLLNRDREDHVMQALVLGHARHTGWRRLAACALLQDEAPVFDTSYVTTVMELLKKG